MRYVTLIPQDLFTGTYSSRVLVNMRVKGFTKYNVLLYRTNDHRSRMPTPTDMRLPTIAEVYYLHVTRYTRVEADIVL